MTPTRNKTTAPLIFSSANEHQRDREEEDEEEEEEEESSRGSSGEVGRWRRQVWSAPEQLVARTSHGGNRPTTAKAGGAVANEG